MSTVDSPLNGIDQGLPAHLKVKYFSTLQAYEPILKAMQSFTDDRAPSDPDEIWLLQHFPVFTQGQAGKAEHLLAPGDIPVVQVDRGGQVTYHGPGQLVAYLMLDLKRLGIGPRELVTRIEQALIALLKRFGLNAEARREAPGVYINHAKIASIGLRIRKGRSYHGLSLNVDMELEPFHRINPCGYQNLEMIQLKDMALPDSLDSSLDSVADQLVEEIGNVFGYGSIQIERTEAID